MTCQHVIVGCIVAAAAVWLGYAVYRTFTGKDSGVCGVCSKCFGADRCPTDDKRPDRADKG